MTKSFFAHTLPGRPEKDWQKLEDHLRQVSARAAGFASSFGAEEWGRLAGLWHDLGKYSEAFLDYLGNATTPDPHVAEVAKGPSRIDHSTAGAQHAVATIEILGHLLAYAIAGHHSGLLDGRSERACLEARLAKNVEPWTSAPQALLEEPAPPVPSFLQDAFSLPHGAFAIAFFTRMLFSCLVDADRLDTEEFTSPLKFRVRPTWPEDILPRMESALDARIEGLRPKPTLVNKQRELVRRACKEAAEHPPGLFSLTVPTGGGKTLSSLAFALRHAIRHKLQRVIYVVPFTTIIEQHANDFREVMQPILAEGLPDPVLEHHSNFDAKKETLAGLLATENWDAPLVVTTSVQFYESLFGKGTSSCRKLHNIARSVVILDEVQTLPVDYLSPCLRALEQLASTYRATVVLCTATQPALHRRQEFPIGLADVREIVPEPKRLYAALRRVRVVDIGSVDDEELVERLLQEERVLCIVNTRRHARDLYDGLGKAESHYHLSALMCPEHRSKVLKKIRKRLDDEQDCRLVSTQLIEAGVDIDFPVVYRSLAGLDSIAQAAGRCNRNGSLPEKGRTYIFRSERVRAERFMADTSNCAGQVLPLHQDPLSIEAIEHYFQLYYWDQACRWDAKKILGEFHLLEDRNLPFSFGFAETARRFRLIDQAQRPIIIPWKEEGRALCDELRTPGELPDVQVLRRLQRYTVQLHRRVWEKQLDVGPVELLHDRFAVLTQLESYYYDKTGLSLDDSSQPFLIVEGDV